MLSHIKVMLMQLGLDMAHATYSFENDIGY